VPPTARPGTPAVPPKGVAGERNRLPRQPRPFMPGVWRYVRRVFREPDIDIRPAPGGKLVVEVRGVDVFDPTTGDVRSGGTDDIACWFLDTEYDGDSFFVRHAYFLGGDEPYEKLKRALRAEVDEGEWAKLYSATSQPFDVPKSGKIAVKVINHYGDEVLKVYPVGGRKK
jgi:adenine-specific DNA-methyltransferase